MTKEVGIRMKAYHTTMHEEEESVVVDEMEGFYYERNHFSYITYEQSLEDGGEVVSHMLKFQEHHVILTKKMVPKVVMEFIEGTTTTCDYVTPHGRMILEMEANKIEISKESCKILLYMEYVIKSNQEVVSNCKMHIEIFTK
ncbi:MAG: DUF1934 domain-containing protein [Eubacteriales bacterium]